MKSILNETDALTVNMNTMSFVVCGKTKIHPIASNYDYDYECDRTLNLSAMQANKCTPNKRRSPQIVCTNINPLRFASMELEFKLRAFVTLKIKGYVQSTCTCAFVFTMRAPNKTTGTSGLSINEREKSRTPLCFLVGRSIRRPLAMIALRLMLAILLIFVRSRRLSLIWILIWI